MLREIPDRLNKLAVFTGIDNAKFRSSITPGDQLRNALAGRLSQLARIDLPDIESEPLALQPEQLDLAVSALAFQFVNDLPGVLAQIRRALKPDGFLLAAMIGGDTLTELRQSFAVAEAELEGGVSPRVAPFVDLRDVGALLQRAKFALPVTDVDRIVVRADISARLAESFETALELADGVPVQAKHANDYLRLVERVSPAEMEAAWPDHRRPSHPAEFREARAVLRNLIPARPDLLTVPEYSRNAEAICARCHPVTGFPLADPRTILALLGYC